MPARTHSHPHGTNNNIATPSAPHAGMHHTNADPTHRLLGPMAPLVRQFAVLGLDDANELLPLPIQPVSAATPVPHSDPTFTTATATATATATPKHGVGVGSASGWASSSSALPPLCLAFKGAVLSSYGQRDIHRIDAAADAAAAAASSQNSTNAMDDDASSVTSSILARRRRRRRRLRRHHRHQSATATAAAATATTTTMTATNASGMGGVALQQPSYRGIPIGVDASVLDAELQALEWRRAGRRSDDSDAIHPSSSFSMSLQDQSSSATSTDSDDDDDDDDDDDQGFDDDDQDFDDDQDQDQVNPASRPHWRAQPRRLDSTASLVSENPADRLQAHPASSQEEVDCIDPEMLGLFCLPNGIRFSRSQGKPVFYTFVMTLSDGTRLYGANLLFHERVTSPNVRIALRMLSDIYKIEHFDGAAVPPSILPFLVGDESTPLFAPKVLCITSVYPAFTAFREYLTQLHSSFVEVETDIPLECFVHNLVEEVPLPRPNQIVEFKCRESIFVTRPATDELPLFDFSFMPLFKCLGLDNVLVLFRCLLAEQRIVLKSRDLELLSPCVLAAESLLYPLHWQHIFIPILPLELRHFLQSPVPYVVGMACVAPEASNLSDSYESDRANASAEALPRSASTSPPRRDSAGNLNLMHDDDAHTDRQVQKKKVFRSFSVEEAGLAPEEVEQVVWVDLDAGTVIVPVTDEPVPRLPLTHYETLYSKLYSTLATHLNSVEAERLATHSGDSAAEAQNSAAFLDAHERQLTMVIRMAFVEFFAGVLDGYEDFVVDSEAVVHGRADDKTDAAGAGLKDSSERDRSQDPSSSMPGTRQDLQLPPAGLRRRRHSFSAHMSVPSHFSVSSVDQDIALREAESRLALQQLQLQQHQQQQQQNNSDQSRTRVGSLTHMISSFLNPPPPGNDPPALEGTASDELTRMSASTELYPEPILGGESRGGSTIAAFMRKRTRRPSIGGGSVSSLQLSMGGDGSETPGGTSLASVTRKIMLRLATTATARTDDGWLTNFDTAGFVADKPSSDRSFLVHLLSTQAFHAFIDDRRVSPELQFFDLCLRKSSYRFRYLVAPTQQPLPVATASQVMPPPTAIVGRTRPPPLLAPSLDGDSLDQIHIRGLLSAFGSSASAGSIQNQFMSSASGGGGGNAAGTPTTASMGGDASSGFLSTDDHNLTALLFTSGRRKDGFRAPEPRPAMFANHPRSLAKGHFPLLSTQTTSVSASGPMDARTGPASQAAAAVVAPPEAFGPGTALGVEQHADTLLSDGSDADALSQHPHIAVTTPNVAMDNMAAAAFAVRATPRRTLQDRSRLLDEEGFEPVSVFASSAPAALDAGGFANGAEMDEGEATASLSFGLTTPQVASRSGMSITASSETLRFVSPSTMPITSVDASTPTAARGAAANRLIADSFRGRGSYQQLPDSSSQQSVLSSNDKYCAEMLAAVNAIVHRLIKLHATSSFPEVAAKFERAAARSQSSSSSSTAAKTSSRRLGLGQNPNNGSAKQLGLSTTLFEKKLHRRSLSYDGQVANADVTGLAETNGLNGAESSAATRNPSQRQPGGAASSSQADSTVQLRDSTRHNQETLVTLLCLTLERIWAHGLKMSLGKSSFWQLLQLSEQAVDLEPIVQLKELRSGFARGRAWVRYCLERRILAQQVDRAMAEADPYLALYHPTAFLCNPELRLALIIALAGLSMVESSEFSASYELPSRPARASEMLSHGIQVQRRRMMSFRLSQVGASGSVEFDASAVPPREEQTHSATATTTTTTTPTPTTTSNSSNNATRSRSQSSSMLIVGPEKPGVLHPVSLDLKPPLLLRSAAHPNSSRQTTTSFNAPIQNPLHVSASAGASAALPPANPPELVHSASAASGLFQRMRKGASQAPTSQQPSSSMSLQDVLEDLDCERQTARLLRTELASAMLKMAEYESRQRASLSPLGSDAASGSTTTRAYDSLPSTTL
ncbi:hypothetical protein CAOG_03814 [Capsaspora owczarzaki ATCC 30864]|uniref:UDENN domain-containing protein n=1 Tax=Capsaspora owczarzaki (strain ATCC 30864) TaxID=595528 RepID=A0A0D2VQI6_CAPO3|nr:hypothetical protein CAOG_03814 [Capsaspora owczarzaki ATCC 30864]KJE92932.1 hypothetical protein CAOG_003814 [Capsaspora owczarzaki ATCC 30864]|eukprot:XP_004363542.1 hypothetical protein CAOG_03814 [Capsaspora owczarzaki ATCC 30864]